MTTPAPAGPPARLPWDPLESWRTTLGSRWLARRFDVSVETLFSWRTQGVPAAYGDRIARALAESPTATAAWLWPEAR